MFRAILFLLLTTATATAQIKHYSTESEAGHQPCYDTLRVFGFKTIQDVDRMMPTWAPVRGYDTVVVMEGMVERKGEGHAGPHIASEDLPLFHNTHDFCFNIEPDNVF